MLCWLLSWGGTTRLAGQELWTLPQGLGLSGGLKVDLGYPTNRLGLQARAYFVRDFVQVNAALAIYRNFTHLGPRPVQPGLELKASLGAVAGWGPADQAPHPFLHPVSNHTRRRYALGYAWQLYLDRMGTTQHTAVVGLHLGPWEILSENDAFTGMIYDRYRTGTLALAYRRDSLRYMLSTTLWTGDPRGIRRIRDSDYPARYGYKDLTMAPYGSFSHGILAAQVSTALPYYHLAHASVGIDAEQVRHWVQNRFIHDMWFFPERWTTVRNPHYPMLDRTGRPYLYQPGQRIRRPRPYLSLGLNPSLFY